MKNVILPHVVCSQIYNFGNNEVQTPNLDVSIDSKVSSIYDGSFFLESKVDGNFPIPCQHYQSGFHFTSSSWENNIQQSMLLNKKVYVAEELNIGAAQIRKRSADLIERRTVFGEYKKNKRRKAASCEDECHDQVKESTNIKEHKLPVPVRRSQKLSDKITALQKLVSPYGKTDTASVLEEASLYIKLVQQQIKNLFQMLSSTSTSQEIEDTMADLQSRGLCLFPISIMQKLSQEHCFHTSNNVLLNIN